MNTETRSKRVGGYLDSSPVFLAGVGQPVARYIQKLQKKMTSLRASYEKEKHQRRHYYNCCKEIVTTFNTQQDEREKQRSDAEKRYQKEIDYLKTVIETKNKQIEQLQSYVNFCKESLSRNNLNADTASKKRMSIAKANPTSAIAPKPCKRFSNTRKSLITKIQTNFNPIGVTSKRESRLLRELETCQGVLNRIDQIELERLRKVSALTASQPTKTFAIHAPSDHSRLLKLDGSCSLHRERRSPKEKGTQMATDEIRERHGARRTDEHKTCYNFLSKNDEELTSAAKCWTKGKTLKRRPDDAVPSKALEGELVSPTGVPVLLLDLKSVIRGSTSYETARNELEKPQNVDATDKCVSPTDLLSDRTVVGEVFHDAKTSLELISLTPVVTNEEATQSHENIATNCKLVGESNLMGMDYDSLSQFNEANQEPLRVFSKSYEITRRKSHDGTTSRLNQDSNQRDRLSRSQCFAGKINLGLKFEQEPLTKDTDTLATVSLPSVRNARVRKEILKKLLEEKSQKQQSQSNGQADVPPPVPTSANMMESVEYKMKK